MKTAGRPLVEWILVAVLAAVLIWRVSVDFTRPLVYGADRWMYVIPHLHIYAGLAFASVMIAARVGRTWFPLLLVAACFWVFPVAYRKHGHMVESRDTVSLRSLSQRMERRFWIEAARDVTIAMTIAALGVIVIVKERHAQPGATDNPDDAQRLREDY